MRRVILANRIYNVTGNPCHPWEVDDYPDDWLDALTAFAVDVPRQMQAKAEARASMRRR